MGKERNAPDPRGMIHAASPSSRSMSSCAVWRRRGMLGRKDFDARSSWTKSRTSSRSKGGRHASRNDAMDASRAVGTHTPMSMRLDTRTGSAMSPPPGPSAQSADDEERRQQQLVAEDVAVAGTGEIAFALSGVHHTFAACTS